MTFSDQDLSHAYCVPGAPQLTIMENYNQKVIWKPLPPYHDTSVISKVPTSQS